MLQKVIEFPAYEFWRKGIREIGVPRKPHTAEVFPQRVLYARADPDLEGTAFDWAGGPCASAGRADKEASARGVGVLGIVPTEGSSKVAPFDDEGLGPVHFEYFHLRPL